MFKRRKPPSLTKLYIKFICVLLCSILFAATVCTVLLTMPGTLDVLSSWEVPKEEEEQSATNTQAQTQAPLTSDSTLNLLLLEQTVNKDYYKELFGLYKLASEGSLWSGQKEPFITIDFQFKQHSSESTLGTYIPKDKSGKIKWNEAAAGYPAHAFRSISLNSYVINTVNSSNLSKKLNQSPMGTMPTNGMIAGDGLNTVAYFQITADYFSGFTSAGTQGTSPAADNKILEPYGVTQPGKRLSDPYYLPDQLVWLANEYAKVSKKWISEDFFAKKGVSPSVKSKIISPLMTYNHSGEAWTTPRCYLGFGANIGTLKKDGFTLTGLTEEESYYKVGEDMLNMANKMPKDFIIPALNSNQSKAMVALVPIIFDDTYRINEAYSTWMLSHKKETLEMYKKLTQKPSATEADMVAFVKSKTEEPVEYAKMFGVSKVHGDPAVWCKMDGTITNKKNGKSAKRIQLHTWIVWRAAFYGVGLTEQMYGKLLAEEKVPGVDALKPETYLQTLGQINNAVNITSPNTNAPASGTSNVDSEVKHNWVKYHKNKAPGKILEVGWKDGMPIFYQNLNKGPLAKWQIPKPQKVKSLTGPFEYYKGSDDTLCWSGCGMNTMTSILHGVGLGNNPEIANMVDEGTGEKNLFSPVDLAHYFAYLQSSSFPSWYMGGMAHQCDIWMTYLGAPSVNFSTKNTAALKAEMQKGYPVIVSSPNSCRYSFYEYTDDKQKKVTKRLSNYPLTNAGHIVAFYGCYTFEKDTGGTDTFVKLIDTSNHSKGVNHMFVPISELAQINYSVLVQKPIVQNNMTPSTSAPVPSKTPPNIKFKPNSDKAYWANIETSLLDMPYDLRVGTTNIRRVRVPASQDIRIAVVPGDVVSFKLVRGDLFNVTIFRNDVAYIINNIRLMNPTGIDGKGGRQPLLNDIDLNFPNNTNVNIAMFNTDKDLKFTTPYEDTVSKVAMAP